MCEFKGKMRSFWTNLNERKNQCSVYKHTSNPTVLIGEVQIIGGREVSLSDFAIVFIDNTEVMTCKV